MRTKYNKVCTNSIRNLQQNWYTALKVIVGLRGYEKYHIHQESMIEKATQERDIFYKETIFDKLLVAVAEETNETIEQ